MEVCTSILNTKWVLSFWDGVVKWLGSPFSGTLYSVLKDGVVQWPAVRKNGVSGTSHSCAPFMPTIGWLQGADTKRYQVYQRPFNRVPQQDLPTYCIVCVCFFFVRCFAFFACLTFVVLRSFEKHVLIPWYISVSYTHLTLPTICSV